MSAALRATNKSTLGRVRKAIILLLGTMGVLTFVCISTCTVIAQQEVKIKGA
jgi:hypothetical protein